jgi:hypothetical protein
LRGAPQRTFLRAIRLISAAASRSIFGAALPAPVGPDTSAVTAQECCRRDERRTLGDLRPEPEEPSQQRAVDVRKLNPRFGATFASRASRSAANRTVFARTAHRCASYSAFAALPSRASAALISALCRVTAGSIVDVARPDEVESCASARALSGSARSTVTTRGKPRRGRGCRS